MLSRNRLHIIFTIFFLVCLLSWKFMALQSFKNVLSHLTHLKQFQLIWMLFEVCALLIYLKCWEILVWNSKILFNNILQRFITNSVESMICLSCLRLFEILWNSMSLMLHLIFVFLVSFNIYFHFEIFTDLKISFQVFLEEFTDAQELHNSFICKHAFIYIAYIYSHV